MTVELPFTMNFIIYLTNRCNLSCEMCTQYGDNYKENAPKELSVEEWDKFFLRISDINPKPKVILIGGEPMLYKGIDSILNLIKKYDFSAHIVTNGTLLEKHLDTLFDMDINITISVDGLENIHDKIRGKVGTFKKVIENIKLANELQKKGARFSLLLNTVILPDNVDTLADFVKYMQQFNIEQFVFQHLQFATPEMHRKTHKEWEDILGEPFCNNFITKGSYSITKDYIKKIQENLAKVALACTKEAFVFPYLTDTEMEDYYLEKNLKQLRPYYTCTTPWLTVFISPDGYISNCIQNTIGNIKENDFWDLWNNEKANKLRNVLCQNGSFDFCKKCCNFYKENFLLAPQRLIKLKDKILILDSELNYVKSCPDGVFILDKNKQIIDNKIPVIPLELHSKEQIEELTRHETIIGFFNEIKNI